MKDEHLKRLVKEFWEKEPCGSNVAQSIKYTWEYFNEIEEHRYRVEPFIHQFAQFTRYRGKKVLEIGVGAGTDHAQFARAGALLYGIDLTDAAIDMVTSRLALEGLESVLYRADAENLPFESNYFDYVYSWGVLHHTPDTEKAIDEIYRVCQPEGKICIMLYHRFSLVTFKLWLAFGLLRLKPFRTLNSLIGHHMESKGTKAYTFGEIRQMFNKFNNVVILSVLTSYDIDRIPRFIVKYIPHSWGWFLVIQAIK